jgi:hypothetical protein
MGQVIEFTGYGASIFVLISFLMKDIRVLRIVNSVGCLLFILYGILLFSVPVVLTNVAIVIINMIYLFRRKPVTK